MERKNIVYGWAAWAGTIRKGREIVLALVRVMRHLGASFGVLRKEKCTGDPVRRLGNDLLFQQLAEANLEALAQNRVKKIVTICPHCVRTIQEDWKEFGTPPEVEHHSEFLARHLPDLVTPVSRPAVVRASPPALSNPTGDSRTEKIVFHDPCYLGRYRNVYDEPRQIAALAGELVEAPRSHERSFCCGAGGGLAFLGEEKGERVSQVRAAELVATGARRSCRSLPLLQYDVPGCTRSARRRCPGAVGHCASWRRGDCRRTS